MSIGGLAIDPANRHPRPSRVQLVVSDAYAGLKGGLDPTSAGAVSDGGAGRVGEVEALAGTSGPFGAPGRSSGDVTGAHGHSTTGIVGLLGLVMPMLSEFFGIVARLGAWQIDTRPG